jgi:hypothetical protein
MIFLKLRKRYFKNKKLDIFNQRELMFVNIMLISCEVLFIYTETDTVFYNNYLYSL